MDVWETVQVHTLPLSPQDLKRQYGRHITFFGAVSTQRLPFSTPAQVRDEVRRCIDALGEGGGYICGPDHHVKPDVSAENTVALFRRRPAECRAPCHLIPRISEPNRMGRDLMKSQNALTAQNHFGNSC